MFLFVSALANVTLRAKERRWCCRVGVEAPAGPGAPPPAPVTSTSIFNPCSICFGPKRPSKWWVLFCRSHMREEGGSLSRLEPWQFAYAKRILALGMLPKCLCVQLFVQGFRARLQDFELRPHFRTSEAALQDHGEYVYFHRPWLVSFPLRFILNTNLVLVHCTLRTVSWLVSNVILCPPAHYVLWIIPLRFGL